MRLLSAEINFSMMRENAVWILNRNPEKRKKDFRSIEAVGITKFFYKGKPPAVAGAKRKYVYMLSTVTWCLPAGKSRETPSGKNSVTFCSVSKQ